MGIPILGFICRAMISVQQVLTVAGVQILPYAEHAASQTDCFTRDLGFFLGSRLVRCTLVVYLIFVVILVKSLDSNNNSNYGKLV